VVAPLVARMGEAKVSMPGGCAIGTRPVADGAVAATPSPYGYAARYQYLPRS